MKKIKIDNRYCCKKLSEYMKRCEIIYVVTEWDKLKWIISVRNDRGYMDGVVAMFIYYCPFCGRKLARRIK